MGKTYVTPVDVFHNACNYITLKLDDINYVQWSYQVEKFFMVHLLSGFLDVTVTTPIDSNGDAYLECEVVDIAVLNLIVVSLSMMFSLR